MKCFDCKQIWDLGEVKQEEDFICSYCIDKKDADAHKNEQGGKNHGN